MAARARRLYDCDRYRWRTGIRLDRPPRGGFFCAASKGECDVLDHLHLRGRAGGALGSLARYLISIWALPMSRDLPWGTIGINIAGSLLIGFSGTMMLAHGRYPVAENWRLFVMAEPRGGFTTFSSFSLQTLDLMRSGAMKNASVNIIASVVLWVWRQRWRWATDIAAQFNQVRIAGRTNPDRGRRTGRRLRSAAFLRAVSTSIPAAWRSRVQSRVLRLVEVWRSIPSGK